MKDISKDIIKAATILTKSLMVLDKIAQTGQPDVPHEFIIKHEINQKYIHLCSDKVPMTRLLFGDDVSQSAKHIDDPEKLRSKIATRKLLAILEALLEKCHTKVLCPGSTCMVNGCLDTGVNTGKPSHGKVRRQKTSETGVTIPGNN
ncbi:hypothetical protein E2C01_042541 [Portunus trituberculatus]|uniref:Uncharacterized protein n=1 Tax=Portunus trituberculatus TaxID=210409 RepID=A0A5B7FV31_PORTR|nr:hypothetical protein [Portunus trituberculatus]